MPFTVSHAAAAVPFARCGLVLSALVVGSMAPDYEYFLRFSVGHRFGHTLPGLFLFCVPTGLIALWLYHNVLKLPLLSLLPLEHQRRLIAHAGPFSFLPLARLWRIVASLVIGAGTHLLWDSFTHANAAGTVLHPFLSRPLIVLDGYRFLACDAAQLASSGLGLLLLALMYMRWYRHAPRRSVPAALRIPGDEKLDTIATLALTASLLALAYAFHRTPLGFDVPSVRLFGGRAVVAGLTFLLVEMLLFGTIRSLALIRANVHDGSVASSARSYQGGVE